MLEVISVYIIRSYNTTKTFRTIQPRHVYHVTTPSSSFPFVSKRATFRRDNYVFIPFVPRSDVIITLSIYCVAVCESRCCNNDRDAVLRHPDIGIDNVSRLESVDVREVGCRKRSLKWRVQNIMTTYVLSFLCSITLCQLHPVIAFNLMEC